jgi:hypothetical protein
MYITTNRNGATNRLDIGFVHEDFSSLWEVRSGMQVTTREMDGDRDAMWRWVREMKRTGEKDRQYRTVLNCPHPMQRYSRKTFRHVVVATIDTVSRRTPGRAENGQPSHSVVSQPSFSSVTDDTA